MEETSSSEGMNVVIRSRHALSQELPEVEGASETASGCMGRKVKKRWQTGGYQSSAGNSPEKSPPGKPISSPFCGDDGNWFTLTKTGYCVDTAYRTARQEEPVFRITLRPHVAGSDDDEVFKSPAR